MTYAGFLRTSGSPATPFPPFSANSDKEAREIADKLALSFSRPGVTYVATVWESRDGKARTLAA